MSHQPGLSQNPHVERRRRITTRLLLGTVFVVLSLPAMWPFMSMGLTFSADGLLHVLRTAMLVTYRQEGMFFPRWMPDLVLGYGYPLISFYGSATYYLASLFVFLGVDPAQALLLTFVTLLLLAGGGMYLLVFHLVEDTDGWKRHAAAMVGAVAYLYAPYLLINTYARGAVAEVGAQMLLPWILWFLRRIFYASNPTPYTLGFALSAALLALTHNISLLFMPPMIVAFGLAVIWQARPLHRALPQRIGVALLAGAGGLGVSAFFWLPLLLERSNLADTAFAIAARYIGENTWTLWNFLELSWFYKYSTAIPFQLGTVQLLLATLGFLMLPRRTTEWWALLAILLVACLMISTWTLPLWLNSQILLIAQFPWRLLAVASLPLAIFPAGIVLRVQQRWAALVVSLMLIGIIIISQRPSATYFAPLLNQPVSIGRPATAQFEFQTNAFGTSSSSEFLPRWAGQNLFGMIENLTVATAPILDIQLQTATLVQIEAVITTTQTVDLNVTNFYFPGWSATIDGQPAQLRPDPERGMQTLTLPVGVHQIIISEKGTPQQQKAGLLSLFTLATLTIGVWWKGAQWRRLAVVPALCVLAGVFAILQPAPRPDTWRSATTPIARDSLELLGYRYQVEEEHLLHIFPYWLVHKPTDSKVSWQIVDAGGRVLTELSSDAFFNTLQLGSIPALTIFDDAYQLTLPPGLAAGEYELRVAVGPSTLDQIPSFFTAGTLQLPDVSEVAPLEMNALDFRFGTNVVLDGWSMRVDGRSATGSEAVPLLLRADQIIEYTLYWRAEGAVEENYHGFVHLLDHAQQAVRQQDKTAGSLLAPARLWNPFCVQPDTYRFVIDDAMPGGIYRPTIGLYRFATDGQRLPITNAKGQIIGSEFALPLIKVLSETLVTPEQPVNTRLGEWGELEGFSMTSSSNLAPGDVVTLTLVCKALAPASVDYTRFLHVYDPVRGMAAQHDAPPLEGGNPTTLWVAGERIVESVALKIAADAQPGEYTIWFGMYDPSNGQSAPLSGRTGKPEPNNQLLLTTVYVVSGDAQRKP